MKKTALFAAFAALALTAGLNSCGNDNSKSDANNDSTSTEQAEGFESTSNIRFFNPDSVNRAYTLSIEIMEKNQKAMLELQRFKQSKANELTNIGMKIDQKAKSGGYISQASYEADVKDFQRKQAEAEKIVAAREQKLQEEMLQDDARLNDSLMNFIKEYNAGHKYDAIITSTAALYYNPSLDITTEIIEGLNSRYTPAKKDDSKKDGEKPIPGKAK